MIQHEESMSISAQLEEGTGKRGGDEKETRGKESGIIIVASAVERCLASTARRSGLPRNAITIQT